MPQPIDRREAIKLASGAAASAFLSAQRSSHASSPDNERPNIILIMADDMGYSDLGCYGSEIRTPNIDRLASGGMRFTRFYNAARCCPTRASLLTGCYPHRAGVGHMIHDHGLPAYRGRLGADCVTIAETLRPAGYQTLMSGKWHVGENRPHWPLDRGFDRYYGLLSGACNFWSLDPGRHFARDNTPIHRFNPGHYMTDAFSDNAVHFIDEASDDTPYFLYMPYTAPHWPLHAHPEDIERYRGTYRIGWDELRERRHARMKELGLIDADQPLPPRDPGNTPWESAEHKDWQDARMATYAAQIESMDRGIGRILDAVKAKGQEDNTLVLFLCDNGGCHEGRPGNDPSIMPGPEPTFQSYGREWAEASNTPFRKYKHWVHEGGSSTPLVAYWPNRIKPGQTTSQVGHVIDFLPTFAEAAGAEYPDTYNGNEIKALDGKSLMPVFDGEEREPHESLLWEHCGNKAIQKGDWKLVAEHRGEWELYNLAEDRIEQNNLAASNQSKLNELKMEWERWANDIGAIPYDELRKRPRVDQRG